MNGLRILFLSTKATRPSHRFRVEQVLPHLERRGHRCAVGFFPKNPFVRFWFYRQLTQFDVVFIQQRTLDPIELRLVRRLSACLVFDLDDSVMFDSKGQHDRRRSTRFSAMVRAADLVISGNRFLRERVAECAVSAKRSLGMTVLPTAIDTERFRPGLTHKTSTDRCVIGWTGSRSTNPYLNAIFPILATLSGPFEVRIISDTTDGLDFSQLGSIPYRFVKWFAETEVVETAKFDIGLMPLPDDNSTRGKCGCKALQYMSLGIPAVCSPVGVNRDIVQPDRNGCLPQTDDEWKLTLNRLIANVEMRQMLGQAGRRTVEAKYSLTEVANQLGQMLEKHCQPLRKTA